MKLSPEYLAAPVLIVLGVVLFVLDVTGVGHPTFLAAAVVLVVAGAVIAVLRACMNRAQHRPSRRGDRGAR